MKTKKLQENDAPEGYVAVEIPRYSDPKKDICTGCAFVKENQCGNDRPCTPYDRKDGLQVIFKKSLDNHKQSAIIGGNKGE